MWSIEPGVWTERQAIAAHTIHNPIEDCHEVA